jgi:NACalpha-BTF3-like transcription factor
MTAREEAKQLDSVTDRVQDKEFDENVAKDAMSALRQQSENQTEQQQTVAVSKDDVDLIVEQLEVSRDEAERALREVKDEDGKSALFLALRKLVNG